MKILKYKNNLLIISLILNLIFIAFVFMYVIRNKESLIQKFIWRFDTEKVIMFGDSHTARGNWNELLNRCDVLNLGFSGFTSGQLEFMMKQYIINRQATYCLIQCGGNDLNRSHFDQDEMNNNIISMIQYLKANNITPVLQSLFHRPNAEYNIMIDSLNNGLEQIAKTNQVDFIDVNPYLDNNNIEKHVESDNIHLNKKGYEIWGELVKTYLIEKETN